MAKWLFKWVLCGLIGALPMGFLTAQTAAFQCKNGRIQFISDAPLEMINAQSEALKGIIDPQTHQFAFSVRNRSFKGFKSPLQEEHFNENYMESHRNENSTFEGKIIEKVNFDQNGTQTVRAKGKLTVHGVTKERIIKSTIDIQGKKIVVKAQFTVPLAEHNIAIPKIVYQKIAEIITININAVLTQP